MKKSILIVSLCLITIAMQAQWWVGGSVGYVYDDGNKPTPNSITVSPIGGYSFNERWGVGLGIAITDDFGKNVNSFAIGINPFARYTAFSYEGFSILFDGGINFQNVTYSVNKDSDNYSNLFVGIKPGFCYSFNDKFCVVTHLGFVGYQGRALGHHTETNRVGFKLDSETINFGLYYCF